MTLRNIVISQCKEVKTMSKYTTGEIARLCDVSVRTVQYYDSRKILVPSELSEGGRRLYSEDDLRKLKVICFLRSVDVPINSISQLFEEKNPEKVISILLEQQKKELSAEVLERQQKLEVLNQIEREMKMLDNFSVESINDIVYKMKNTKKLRKVRITMLCVGVVMDLIEWATLILWIAKGIWIPFVIGLPIVIGLGIFISKFYFNSVAYICPECHAIFKPKFKEAFWAKHTPTTRKLTCTKCGHKGFCVETCEEETK